MISIDLHVHSIFSDGLLSPAELCAMAARKRVGVLALCDHDTVAGIRSMMEAAEAQTAQGYPTEVIPAIELSAGPDGRIHILGYGVDPENRILLDALEDGRIDRHTRCAGILLKLKELGIIVPPEMLPQEDSAGMPVGRAHVARALIQMGIVNTMEQAFDKYLGEGKPAYIPLDHLSAEAAVKRLAAAGAVPVMAHPMRIGLTTFTLEALVTSLQTAGLAGVEVYHPSASRSDISFLFNMAQRHGLLVTGGSDFHGDRGSRAKLGGIPGSWNTWQSDLIALKDAIIRRSPSVQTTAMIDIA